MASTAERDIASTLWKQPKGISRIAITRVFVVGFAFLTMIIALDPPGGIVTLTAFSGSLYAVCFAPAILLGLWWRRGNGIAVVSSFVVGIGVLMVWPTLPISAALHAVFPAACCSLLVYVTIAGLSPCVAEEVVGRLFSGASPSDG